MSLQATLWLFLFFEHGVELFAIPTEPSSFNCLTGLNRTLLTWSPRKRAWCCLHKGRGCLADVPSILVPTNSEPYDCQAGYSLPSRTWWSQGKRDWCCKSHHIDCPTKAPAVLVSPTTTTILMAPQTAQHQTTFNCKDGRPTWSWSQEKQFSCCFYQMRGCWPGSPPPGSVKTTNAIEIPATTFPLAPTTTTTYFLCRVEDWNIERRMSADERQWCCRHQGYGCSTTTTSALVVLTTTQEKIESASSALSDGNQDMRAPWRVEEPGHLSDQNPQTLDNFFPQLKFDASHVRLAWSRRTWTIALASAACALCALRALVGRPWPRNCCCHLFATLQGVLSHLQPRSHRCAGYLRLDAAAAALERCGELRESTSPRLRITLQQDCTEA